MKRRTKTQVTLLLALSLILGLVLPAYGEDLAVPMLISEPPEVISTNVDEILGFYETQNPSLDWEEIIAKYAAGYVFDTDYKDILGWDLTLFTEDKTPSFYGSRIMALMAIGVDPRDFEGRDLLQELAGMMDEKGGFGTFSDQVYAMLALNVLDTEYDEDMALEALIGMQNEDGGFGFAPGNSDLDTTGTALMALAAYKGNHVTEAIEKALAYIEPQQLPTGGFPSWGTENSNTIARVTSGLVAVGEDIYSDKWTVDGHTVLDALAAYEMEDHSYSWQLDPKESNGFSTKQVLMMYADLKNGETSFAKLKDMNKEITVSVRVEGAQDTVIDTDVEVKYFGAKVTTKQVLEVLFTENDIEYDIESSTYGNFLSGVAGESAGTFGGYDGWMYLINGASGWGIDSDQIQDNDQILLYYGDMAPATLVPNVTVEAVELAPYEPFRIHVTATYDDYDANWNPTPVTVDIADAQVVLAGEIYTTDKNGYVTIDQEQITFDEVLTYQVSKDVEGGVPQLVRTPEETVTITYNADKKYNDDALIKGWASESVYAARDAEIMVGTANNFKPEKLLTKAELAALIVRMTEREVADYGTDFSDVLPLTWYYTFISTGEHYDILDSSEHFFDPGRVVTRAEFAKMVAYAFDLESEVESPVFVDVLSYEADVVDAIEAVSEAGLLVGDADHFYPDMYVSREMAAVVMMRLDAME